MEDITHAEELHVFRQFTERVQASAIVPRRNICRISPSNFPIAIAKSIGRRKWDHERIFEETLQQVETGMTVHWNDIA